MCATGHANSATLSPDGALELGATGYQLGFSVPFVDDKGATIGGGKLYFGINSADSTQFLYFQMPLTYVDNTYGANQSQGWTDIGKNHSLDDLLGSDSLGSTDKKGLPFSWNGNSGKIDYLAYQEGVIGQNDKGKDIKGPIAYLSAGFADANTNKDTGGHVADKKIDGAISAGSTASIVQIATSLEYDLQVVDPTATTDSSLNPNWIPEVGYEIQFAAGTFDASEWLDSSIALSLIQLGNPHVSPSLANFDHYGDPTCIVGCGTATTPLPASLPLFAGGLGVVGWLARRRSRRKKRDTADAPPAAPRPG